MHSKAFAATVSLTIGLVLIFLGILGLPSRQVLATEAVQGPVPGAIGPGEESPGTGEIVILINGQASKATHEAGDATPAGNPDPAGTDSSLARLRKGEGLPPGVGTEAVPAAAVAVGVADGSFENGPDGTWQEASLKGWPLILSEEYLLVPPHRGRWAVWLGGDNDEISFVRQQVTLPSSKADAVLSWWLWIASEDACGNDYFYILINDAYGRLDLCSAKNTEGWARVTADLGNWAGQTVWLQLRVETNSSLNSNGFLDDVGFEALQPELTLAHLPLVQRGKPAVQTFAPPCSASNGYCEPYNAWRDAYGPMKPGAAYSAYPNDQTDYYYFTVEQRRSVTIQITNYQANGQKLIRHEQLAELAKDVHVPPSWDGTMTVSGLDLRPGKYFIQLFTTADHNQDHRYNLTVSQ